MLAYMQGCLNGQAIHTFHECLYDQPWVHDIVTLKVGC